jgi:hypothetical protein
MSLSPTAADIAAGGGGKCDDIPLHIEIGKMTWSGRDRKGTIYVN